MSTFIKTDSKMRYTLGVVYAPDEVDSQGDFSTIEEIEKACHDFMRNLQDKQIKKGALGFMHKDWSDDIGDIVECFIAPADMSIGDAEIAKGTWLLGAVWSEDIFQKIEDGEITGYSMGGSGTREKVDEVTKQDGSSPFSQAIRKVVASRLTSEGR